MNQNAQSNSNKLLTLVSLLDTYERLSMQRLSLKKKLGTVAEAYQDSSEFVLSKVVEMMDECLSELKKEQETYDRLKDLKLTIVGSNKLIV